MAPAVDPPVPTLVCWLQFRVSFTIVRRRCREYLCPARTTNVATQLNSIHNK